MPGLRAFAQSGLCALMRQAKRERGKRCEKRSLTRAVRSAPMTTFTFTRTKLHRTGAIIRRDRAKVRAWMRLKNAQSRSALNAPGSLKCSQFQTATTGIPAPALLFGTSSRRNFSSSIRAVSIRSISSNLIGCAQNVLRTFNRPAGSFPVKDERNKRNGNNQGYTDHSSGIHERHSAA